LNYTEALEYIHGVSWTFCKPGLERISELCERLTERTGLQKEELPELVTNDGIPFPSRAVIGQLIDIYAEIISAS
jgi:hypothetical protein